MSYVYMLNFWIEQRAYRTRQGTADRLEDQLDFGIR